MNDLENLKDIKYYIVELYNNSWSGCLDKFATKEEAIKCIEKKKDKNWSFRIVEKSIVELIKEKCEEARLNERYEISREKSMYYKKYWSDRFEKRVAEEKKKLQQEMKDILLEWFEINRKVED